jgi:hypothetical protein
MSNRINGDFDTDSIEAFRAAYAAQILEPEDQETDKYTGLPTNLVLNTSPWIQHTGLWKANDGSNKDFQANQILVPGIEEPEKELSDEELEELIDQLLAEDTGDALSEDSIEEGDDYDDDAYFDTGEEEEPELTDDEVERLIDELLSEESELDESDELEELEDDYDEELSDEDIDRIVDELLNESEDDLDSDLDSDLDPGHD